MQTYYTLTEAKAHLSHLLDRVEAGETIHITRYGKPAAELRTPKVEKKKSLLGFMKGEIRIADDFDVWPEDIQRALGMID